MIPLPQGPGSVSYLELVRVLKARELYQNLPDGVEATINDCTNLTHCFSLDHLSILSNDVLINCLTNVEYLNALLV